MTETEAKATINRMMELWTKWTPTTEQINIWITVFKHADEDTAWKVVQAVYSQKAHFHTPNPKDYHEQFMLARGPTDPGVHSSADGPQFSPLYIAQVESRTPRTGKRQRRSTLAYTHGLPDEETMLRHAESEWERMGAMYSGRWVIKDARLTGAFGLAFTSEVPA